MSRPPEDHLDLLAVLERLREAKVQMCRAFFAVRRRDSLAALTHIVNSQKALNSAECDLGERSRR